ncbi:MAG: hypothetical protein ACRD3B_05020, partial [Candidatus Sulfotelmatobacter sp.]
GREALSAVLRASDSGGQIPQLGVVLCKAWGVSSLIDLARAANSVPPPDFSALSLAVIASNDEIALAVLSRAGKELAELAHVVIQRLFGDNDAVVPVARTGGVFRHANLVSEVFYNELRSLSPRVDLLATIVESVDGALRMARKASQASL